MSARRAQEAAIRLRPRTIRILLGGSIATCVGVSCFAPAYAALQDARGKKRLDQVDIKRITTLKQNTILTRRGLDEGRPWLLVTHSLQHGGYLHLGMNMLALGSFGSQAGLIYGPAGFLSLWLGGAYLGGVFSMANDRRFGHDSRHVGASSAVASMISATAVAVPRLRWQLFPVGNFPAWGVATAFALMSVVLEARRDLSNSSGGIFIGHMGHLGGLIFGATFGVGMRLLWRVRGVKPFWVAEILRRS